MDDDQLREMYKKYDHEHLIETCLMLRGDKEKLIHEIEVMHEKIKEIKNFKKLELISDQNRNKVQGISLSYRPRQRGYFELDKPRSLKGRTCMFCDQKIKDTDYISLYTGASFHKECWVMRNVFLLGKETFDVSDDLIRDYETVMALENL
jgi:hypothetical protein